MKLTLVIFTYWLIYSFLGWTVDTVFSSIVLSQWSPGGMFITFGLPIPLAPIYGFGSLALIYTFDFIKKYNLAVRYFYCAILLTAIELAGGLFSQLIFGWKIWDYNNAFLNIGGYTDFFHFIVWGFAGLLLMNFVHPFVKKNIIK